MLSCDNASFGYEGHAVVRGITFTVQAGDYVCIVGENGAGKSTFIKGLLGLIRPISGTVTRSVTPGYMPQQTAAQQDFPASALEVVLSGRLSHLGFSPFYAKEDKRAALASLERLGILHLRGKCFRELSGGQQRRVLLARALMAGDKLLVLDEPTAGLDPEAASALYELLQTLNHSGTAIIMVTHDVDKTLPFATRTLSFGGERDA